MLWRSLDEVRDLRFGSLLGVKKCAGGVRGGDVEVVLVEVRRRVGLKIGSCGAAACGIGWRLTNQVELEFTPHRRSGGAQATGRVMG